MAVRLALSLLLLCARAAGHTHGGIARAATGACPHLRSENRSRFALVCGSGSAAEPAHAGHHSPTPLRHPRGSYHCACCAAKLFPGDAKFDTGHGWPSFWGTVGPGAVELHTVGLWPVSDRTYLRCPVCGAHLGQAHRDGPPPSRKRFTVASACLHYEPDGPRAKEAYDPTTDSWYPAKKGPKGPRQGLLQRFRAGGEALAGAALGTRHPAPGSHTEDAGLSHTPLAGLLKTAAYVAATALALLVCVASATSPPKRRRRLGANDKPKPRKNEALHTI